MAYKQTVQEKVIEIKPIQRETAEICIIGDTPLLVHAWSEKAKRLMQDAQQGRKRAKKALPPKDPFQDYVNALYWLRGKPADMESLTQASFDELVASGKAVFGFPVSSIKAAALSAAYRNGDIPNQACMRGTFYVRGIMPDGTVDTDYAVIDGVPEMRADSVRIGSAQTATADIRYRPMFRQWKMRLLIDRNVNGVVQLPAILNALNLGGYSVGIGEWRPERDGQFGMFHVATGNEGGDA